MENFYGKFLKKLVELANSCIVTYLILALISWNLWWFDDLNQRQKIVVCIIWLFSYLVSCIMYSVGGRIVKWLEKH